MTQLKSGTLNPSVYICEDIYMRENHSNLEKGKYANVTWTPINTLSLSSHWWYFNYGKKFKNNDTYFGI